MPPKKIPKKSYRDASESDDTDPGKDKAVKKPSNSKKRNRDGEPLLLLTN
jgi:hypothetical protein